MASLRAGIVHWGRGASAASCRPPTQCRRVSTPLEQQRSKGSSANAAKYKRKDAGSAAKKKKAWKTYIAHDLKEMQQYSLCDAMRFIRAFEVGSARNPKYEIHINLRSLKNGPVVRNQLRLPHPVKTETRIAAICAPDSKAASEALRAGAVMVGEDNIIDAIREGTFDFERLICHEESAAKFNKAGLGKILGPKGLMPSAKNGTVVKDVASTIRDMAGGSQYRERLGVVRLAVGALNFTPEMLQRNIKAFMDALKKDLAGLSDKINKELHEVVLSSTSAPGFSLSGEFRSKDGIDPKELAKAIPS